MPTSPPRGKSLLPVGNGRVLIGLFHLPGLPIDQVVVYTFDKRRAQHGPAENQRKREHSRACQKEFGPGGLPGREKLGPLVQAGRASSYVVVISRISFRGLTARLD